MGDKDQSTSEMLAESIEASINATVQLIKLPIRIYARSLKSFAKAVEKALNDN